MRQALRFFSFSFSVVFSLSLVFATQIPLDNIPMSQGPALQFNDMPSLADLLTIESSASTFYSYARELSLSELFSRQLQAGFTGTEGQGQGLTLLVPTNKAVMALERKPHQGPPPSDTVISEEEFDKSSKDNVQRWVEAHVIPTSPLTFPGTYDTLLEGKSVSFTFESKEEGWETVTVEDGIRILSMKKASNGVMYLIDGTIGVN